MSDDKKSFPLRISQSVYDELKRWAEQDMRSVNAQVEFLLREAILKRNKTLREEDPKKVSDTFNEQ
jgi:hypothetical protein